MFTIDLRSRVPIYEQLKNQIMEMVVLGALGAHDQLPSIREMARELQLNVNTVKKAYQDLESDGVLYTLSGRGSFVAEDALGGEQLKRRARSALREALASARANGITGEEASRLVEEIYQRTKEVTGDD